MTPPVMLQQGRDTVCSMIMLSWEPQVHHPGPMDELVVQRVTPRNLDTR